MGPVAGLGELFEGENTTEVVVAVAGGSSSEVEEYKQVEEDGATGRTAAEN